MERQMLNTMIKTLERKLFTDDMKGLEKGLRAFKRRLSESESEINGDIDSLVEGIESQVTELKKVLKANDLLWDSDCINIIEDDMKSFKQYLKETALQPGDWIYQKTASDSETYAIITGTNKSGGYKVVKFTIFGGSMAGKATVATTKGWHPAPKEVDMKKVPPKVQQKIMDKAQKYL